MHRTNPKALRAPRGIFVSYRRDDAAGEAGRLADHLSARFRPANVFFDVQHIVPGDDWRQRLDAALSECDTLLVVIGRQWADLRVPSAKRRRLDDAEDTVAWEVSQGLSRGLRVIQVCVQSASPPDPSRLPPMLGGLPQRQAISVRHETFAGDVKTLGDQIVVSRRVRSPFRAGWQASDMSPWARFSPWARSGEGREDLMDASITVVHALELLLARSGAPTQLSAGYLEVKARLAERTGGGFPEVSMAAVVFVATLFGAPPLTAWPPQWRGRKPPKNVGWDLFEFAARRPWCRGDFFRVDGLADAVRQLAAGRPVMTLCWVDIAPDGSGDPFAPDGTLLRAPPLERRNARTTILLIGFDPSRQRFRCMYSSVARTDEHGIFHIPLAVARGALDVSLMWAVGISRDSVEVFRRHARHQTRSAHKA